jgi:hypothetical protein
MSRAVSQELRDLIRRQDAGRPWMAQLAAELYSYPPSRRRQVSPDRQRARARRHRRAYSGVMPADLAEPFTIGEMACLRVVGDEYRKRGYCDLTLAAIAAMAGVCRKTAKRAMQAAACVGLIAIKLRPRPGRKNLANLIKVVSGAWRRWLKRRRSDRGTKKSPHGYSDITQLKSGGAEPPNCCIERGARREAVPTNCGGSARPPGTVREQGERGRAEQRPDGLISASAVDAVCERALRGMGHG